MIVSIEQRADNLIISYIGKDGNISFKKIGIPTNQQYQYVEAYNRSQASPNVRSWNNKLVKKVPTRFLSDMRLQEFFEDAGSDVTDPIFDLNMPNVHSLDIEVNVDDNGFPTAEFANNRINSFAWSHYPNVTAFGIKPLSEKEIQWIQKEINIHLKPIGKEYNFIYKSYENEADMIIDFLKNYMRKAPLITGWNFWNYDWRYIYNRCERLGIDITWLSPTGQWKSHKMMDRGQKYFLMMPEHMLLIDYMAIYQKWDRTIDIKENYTLDWTSEKVLGISKVKYSGGFKELFSKDFDKYIFYNAIDTILVEELHYKLKTMSTFLGLSTITRVEAMQAFSPIRMMEATLARYAYKKNRIIPKKQTKNIRESYEGAFVFQPKPDLYEWVTSWDYASLYPSIMRQFHISIENFITKNINYIPKSNEIKTSSGAIFDSSYESLLPKILTDFYSKRQDSKKIAQQAESEVNYLKSILKTRKKKIILV